MHSVIFKNAENDWKNALPLGNGVFGAMAYYSDGKLHLPMNHYEIYYNISEAVLPEDMLKSSAPENDPGAYRRATVERAERNKAKEGESFTYYRLDKAKPPARAVGGFDGSYPQTGELFFEFSKNLKREETELRLDIEKATVSLNIDKKTESTIRILRKDIILTEVKGAEHLESITMLITAQRSLDMPELQYRQIDKNTFCYEVKMKLGEKKTFSYGGIVKLIGCTGVLEDKKILLTDKNESIKILTGVFTDWRYPDVISSGLSEMEKSLLCLDQLTLEHEKY